MLGRRAADEGVVGSMLFEIWILADNRSIPGLSLFTAPLAPYSDYSYLLVKMVLLYNIVMAILPLVRPKDDLSDIPLTPAQRKLLGLEPSSTPATPGTQYITPPRYARSVTPRSSGGNRSPSYSDSPASTKGGSGLGASLGHIPGSPYSPNASPLLQKAMGGRDGLRRQSYGSPSPLNHGATMGSGFEMPGTPTPSSGKGASVGLNSKWLYEKGRGSAGSARAYS